MLLKDLGAQKSTVLVYVPQNQDHAITCKVAKGYQSRARQTMRKSHQVPRKPSQNMTTHAEAWK